MQSAMALAAKNLGSESREAALRRYYETLYAAYGPQHWWPAQSRFEVIVGAYLTQNTAWTNVERALQRLRSAGVLSLQEIRKIRRSRLERLIRPAGYFRQKAQRLKAFVAFVDRHYAGSLTRMFGQSTSEIRRQLLALHGVGPETADSILLYAGDHPVFVVDAYARRMLARHNVLPENADYEEVRELFQRSLAGMPASTMRWAKNASMRPAHAPSPVSRRKRSSRVQVYNEAHGLIVAIGKSYCLKKSPRCELCPLRQFLPPLPEPARTKAQHGVKLLMSRI